MKARFALADKLLKIKTFDAVKSAFDHIMDMFRLCRGDNMGVRFMAPALFIRLGKDQECYDFLKWWATTIRDDYYGWRDMDLPFLDVRDAVVFESVRKFTGRLAALTHAVALMLIKMRLLRDVKSLKNSHCLYDKSLPPEIVDRIRKEAVGKIVAKRKDILMSSDQDVLIEKLEKQLLEL